MYTISLTILAIWLTTPGYIVSYPIFGTKRYHRAPLISSPLSSIKTNPSVPYYNQLNSYYDSQPSSSLSSYGSGPISINNYPVETDDNFYYIPARHEYQQRTIYGLPTYHGEYKPKPYYYAPAPKFSYYDDNREIASNPMDDLHEEILQEDQRQRELMPNFNNGPMYGQENWYQNGHSNQNDALTNNFLKNLIEYNRQMDVQEKLRREEEEREEEERQYSQYQRDAEIEKPFVDEYDEYAELGDYEYEPQPSENVFDIKKYEQQIRASNDKLNEKPQQIKLPELEDEDVKQLKSLASKSKTTPLPLKAKYDEDYNFDWKPNNFNNNQQYEQDEPEEYDDDAWISWDRKRSVDDQWANMKQIEAIKAFNTRKPLSPVLKEFNDELMLKKLAAASGIISTTPTSSTTLSEVSSTKAPVSSSPSTKTLHLSGQKEVVLPRPATTNRQKMFAAPVLSFVTSQLGKNAIDQKNVIADSQRQQKNNPDSNEMSNRINQKSSSGKIYDTIKQLIAMEHQLEKLPTQSKIQKRYVANEESLVHELDNLKRRSF